MEADRGWLEPVCPSLTAPRSASLTSQSFHQLGTKSSNTCAWGGTFHIQVIAGIVLDAGEEEKEGGKGGGKEGRRGGRGRDEGREEEVMQGTSMF